MIHKSGFDLSQAKKSFMKRGKVETFFQIFAIRQSLHSSLGRMKDKIKNFYQQILGNSITYTITGICQEDFRFIL